MPSGAEPGARRAGPARHARAPDAPARPVGRAGCLHAARAPARPAARASRAPEIERSAMAQRLDVQGAKLAAEQTAKNLGLTRATRFVNVLELGAVRNSSNEAPTQRGWELGFELPLFDWGDARVARAEAVYMQAVHRAAETADQRPLRSARGLWQLPQRLRHRAPPPRRDRAAAQADRRREPAALQRHADRRVRTARRRARADRLASTRRSTRCATSGSRRPTSRWP